METCQSTRGARKRSKHFSGTTFPVVCSTRSAVRSLQELIPNAAVRRRLAAVECAPLHTHVAALECYTCRMTGRHHASFHCHPDQVRPAAQWVEETSAELGLRDGDRKRLALVLEELFANTLEHGRSRDGDAIEVRLDREDDNVRMDYRDPGAAFNPLEIDVSGPPDLENWPVGGMGLRLIQRLATRTAYSFENGVNVISLWLRSN